MTEIIHIEDTYSSSHQKHFLFGEEVTDYQKLITCAVFMKYASKSKSISDRENKQVKENSRQLFVKIINEENTIDGILNSLHKAFNCSSMEAIYAQALIVFNELPNDLLIRSMNFTCRVLTLNNPTEWMDNWRINAFGTCLSMIMWNEFDAENVFTIPRTHKPISSDKGLTEEDYKLFVKYCVNPLREFIIRMDLYPNKPIPSNLRQLREKVTIKNHMTYKEIADKCYRYFPYYYIGSHGCNALIEGDWTIHVPEIWNFLQVYPSAVFGGVFNTSSYGNSGQHWMTVMFHNKQKGSHQDGAAKNSPEAVLFCSQHSDWNSFDISDRILTELRKMPFPTTYNVKNLQTDGYSCGNFGVISNLILLCTDVDVQRSAEMIGENGKNLSKLAGKDINIKTMRSAFLLQK